ncbi:MAG: 30S ribosomal protein S8 [Desulfovibrionaceae bacterium]
MLTDPIADMLTRIRNAHMALHKEVCVSCSKMKIAILEILKKEGYIESFSVEERIIKVSLKYVHGKSALLGLRRKSKPSRRMYVGSLDIPHVQNGLGICVLSTSKGVLTGGEARSINVGGELLCEIW